MPPVNVVRDWRSQLREAIAHTGHKIVSVAAALGFSNHSMLSRMLERSASRVFNFDHAESLRDSPLTRDVWLAFVQLHCAAGGANVVPIDADEHDHMGRLALLIRELGDVPRVYAEKLASGGDVDDTELDELDLQLREAGDAIARARVALRARRQSA